MGAGGGDLERALGVHLALHVGEVRVGGARHDRPRAANRSSGASPARCAHTASSVGGRKDARRRATSAASAAFAVGSTNARPERAAR